MYPEYQKAWLKARAAEIKTVLDASPNLPVNRWTTGVFPRGFSVWLNVNDNSITVWDHTLSSTFAISAETLATSSTVQAVANLMEGRDYALLTGLLDRPPTGPAILFNIENYLNDPTNGFVKPGNLYKEWTARLSIHNPLEILVTKWQDSRSGLTIKVPKFLLLNSENELGDYIRSCSNMMSGIQAKCVEGAPYDGDHAVTDSPISPRSVDRWSVEHITDQYWTISDTFRCVKIPFTSSLLQQESFNVAGFVGYYLSRQYRTGQGPGNLVMP